MKIAFATDDLVHINAHFGWASQMSVYDVTTDGYEFVGLLNFSGDLKEDGNEDKLVPKLKAVADCTIVYVSAIGPSAAARLVNRGITPIKSRSEEDKIEDILNRLVQTLKGNPPPWLRKALGQPKPTFIPNVDR
ncbi:MAG: nitrogen fixation protein NifX [Cyanobacteria bacterium SID2]|nr:nitrogen fixation protein NifX [Cyanobacteria bacterium SID2]MBP0006479.1 nitrogen fixation protein NifX [Cyanobacteria bacterium SBC]